MEQCLSLTAYFVGVPQQPSCHLRSQMQCYPVEAGQVRYCLFGVHKGCAKVVAPKMVPTRQCEHCSTPDRALLGHELY